MFEHDRSAARGQMSTRGLYVFRHEAALGNAPAHSLFDRLSVSRNEGFSVPRTFADYAVRLDGQAVEVGATMDLGKGLSLVRRC